MVELKEIILALLYIVLSIVFFLISKKKRKLARIFIGVLYILICMGGILLFDFSKEIHSVITISSIVLFVHMLNPS